MADVHVISGDGIDQINVVLHIDVPNTNNQVSQNYRTALVNSGLGGTTSMTIGTGPAQILQAEADQITAGEVYEYTTNFPLESAGTEPAAQRASLLAFYASKKTEIQAILQGKLKYTGYTENE